ncbi:sensor histidine kinase [Amycolatopsis tolypomycina]|uniref:histidine kinase n=1 Tax=Amycolatopsis tolypomycina TaxID=208445 RepID=A0A1H4P2U6_9PSEU|nr:sensor histidine kinase [Amycolatopsis tolypomycina]SEC01811.1 Signal transduction histidine kinase [Amycolatopsis tolypomycina]
MQHPRTSAMTGLLAAGCALGVVALALKAGEGTHSALDTALSTTTGFLFLLAGAVAHVRRPANPIGVLIALAGVALFLEDLQFAHDPVLYTIAVPLRAASSPVIAHLVLAFPHGRLRSRWERLLVAAAYLVVLGSGVVGLLVDDDPRDLLALRPGSGAFADRALELAATAISAGVVVVLLYRWLSGRLPQRRLLSPVVVIALAGAVTSGAGTALGDAHPLSDPLLQAYRILFCLWPLAFLAGVLRARVGNAEMIRLLLERDGTGLAALVQDDEVWKDSRSIDALNAAAGLVLDNQRLTAELEQRLAEVRASRARLVAAGDEERRRLERDLHDGAQQRLVSVVLLLRMAARRSGAELPPEIRAVLTGAVDELQTAITELRELARGIRPAILTEAGLVPAVRSLADRIPMEVALTVGTVPRLDAAVEATAYFVTSEALTNALKHARTDRADVRIEVAGAELRVAVTDAGVGGADVEGGTGLAGLRDRVQALGGELDVAGGPGGTTVTAVIPLAS